MWGSMRRLRVLVLCVVVLGAIGFAIALQPAVADQFGYARPFFGLPSRIQYVGADFRNLYSCGGAGGCAHLPPGWQRNFPHCFTRALLKKEFPGTPPVQVGSVPTLFGPAHPVLIPPWTLFQTGATTLWLLVEDGDCYVPYFA